MPKSDRYLMIRQRMCQSGISREQLAAEMGISSYTLRQHLYGERQWRLQEIAYLRDRLNLTDKEIVKEFFGGE